MKVLASAGLAAILAIALSAPAVAPAFAGDCSAMGAAKSVATDHHMKILETLPKTSKSYRFLGQDNNTKDIVGATVVMATCAFSLVANAETTAPWCKYLPNEDHRC
jgi:hypothetical protein